MDQIVLYLYGTYGKNNDLQINLQYSTFMNNEKFISVYKIKAKSGIPAVKTNRSPADCQR